MCRKLCFGFLLLAPAALFAQEALTNESVLKLCKAGIGEDAIVGIPDKVLVAMIIRGAGEVAAPKAETPKAESPAMTKDGVWLSDELGVYWFKDGKYVSAPPEILNLRTAHGAQFAVGIFAAAKLNGYVVEQHSRTHLGPEAEFVLKLAEGTDPAEYVCLGFEVKKDRREVELARGRIDMSTGTQRAAAPFTTEKLAKQIYKLKFTTGKIYTFMVE